VPGTWRHASPRYSQLPALFLRSVRARVGNLPCRRTARSGPLDISRAPEGGELDRIRYCRASHVHHGTERRSATRTVHRGTGAPYGIPRERATSAESVCRMSSRESQCPGPKACDGWEMSAQQRGQIACQRCHGGNPTASAVFPAHLGILGRRHAANRLSRRNVSATGHHVEWLPVEPTDSRHG
jgi:hypothetical protein